MFYNMHKDSFSRLELDEMFTIEELKSSLSEILDQERLFILDLAIFMEEFSKRAADFQSVPKDDMKVIRAMWDGFELDTLLELKNSCSDIRIRNVLTKMLILKGAYKRVNEEFFSIDLEDYFIPREKLISVLL